LSTSSSDPLPESARAILAEEESLLARALAALGEAGLRAARAAGQRGRAQAALRTLQEQAGAASEADLPALLQGLGTAHALARREPLRPPPSPESPYFAHLRLRQSDGVRDYLLGRGTFANIAQGIRIVDWRLSPVAQIFYRYQEGDDYEEPLPGGLATGIVEVRRVLVIERGVLTRVLAGPLVLARAADGSWSRQADGPALLGGGTGTAARAGFLGVGAGAAGIAGRPEITALLDAGQHAAIDAPASRPLLVLGSAGSGKTTVALHRLARIAANDRSGRAPSVVVPEEGLARLSRRLLAPLGMDRIRVETLTSWLRRRGDSAFRGRAPRLWLDTPSLVSSLKRHPALRGPLRERIRPLAGRSLAALRGRLAEAMTDRSFLHGVVVAAAGTLPRTAVEETVRHTMLQLANPLARELRGYDAERLQALDARPLEEGTPDELAGTLDLEDLALLLFLATGDGLRARGALSHLVLDEAEDLSVYELALLGEEVVEGASCTLAGDEMQQTLSSFPGWPGALEALGARDPAVCRLAVSYRCPRPVAELARRVLGAQPGEPTREAQAARDGVPVGLQHFPAEPQSHLFLAAALRDLVDREPLASVGVVASTAEAARGFHHSLSGLPGARLVLDGAFGFEPGIDVTDVDGAKGLEWDYVVVPDATAAAYPADAEARRRLHVAVTRASHQLWIVSSGRRSPILEALA
jgi:DNA helicase-2/ATP-dependent DNA helicase PcrA